MSYRVITWGTGNVGAYAVRAVLNHPELELIGHIVSSPDKVGKDVADLAHLGAATGILATDDIDAALALAPDCGGVHRTLGNTDDGSCRRSGALPEGGYQRSGLFSVHAAVPGQSCHCFSGRSDARSLSGG